MNAKELMIGDYIMLYEDIYIIEEISSKGWAHIIYNDGSKCRVPLSTDYILGELTPVPLTAEILEKNGFRKANYIEVVGGLDTYYLGEEIGSFRIHRLQKGYYQFGLAKIKYVHQLQHAMRLCGIDKEIEL